MNGFGFTKKKQNWHVENTTVTLYKGTDSNSGLNNNRGELYVSSVDGIHRLAFVIATRQPDIIFVQVHDVVFCISIDTFYWEILHGIRFKKGLLVFQTLLFIFITCTKERIYSCAWKIIHSILHTVYQIVHGFYDRSQFLTGCGAKIDSRGKVFITIATGKREHTFFPLLSVRICPSFKNHPEVCAIFVELPVFFSPERLRAVYHIYSTYSYDGKMRWIRGTLGSTRDCWRNFESGTCNGIFRKKVAMSLSAVWHRLTQERPIWHAKDRGDREGSTRCRRLDNYWNLILRGRVVCVADVDVIERIPSRWCYSHVVIFSPSQMCFRAGNNLFP